jgi:hypothetical protein
MCRHLTLFERFLGKIPVPNYRKTFLPLFISLGKKFADIFEYIDSNTTLLSDPLYLTFLLPSYM